MTDKRQLLCKFSNINDFKNVVEQIRRFYTVYNNSLFVFYNTQNVKELYITYNIINNDLNFPKFPGTISIHRKRQTNTLYTLNAMNQIIRDENNGIVLVSETGDIADIPNFTLNDLKDVIRRDVEAVIGCDAVYMLNGWETSKGARAERAIALWLGLIVMYQGDDQSWRG